MYNFINIPSEYKRIIQSVLIDKRASIAAIKDKSGDVIKSYIDAQAALVNGNCMFYKIETDGGNLVGYFTLCSVGIVTSNPFKLLHNPHCYILLYRSDYLIHIYLHICLTASDHLVLRTFVLVVTLFT